MHKPKAGHRPATYQIIVKGTLGSQWSDWFESMKIEAGQAETTITGRNLDQAALHGLLTRVRDLGLPLISIKRIEANRRVKL